MYMRSPHPCGKVSYNMCIKVYFCGKVCILMCSGLVILGSSLSPTRRNVKGGTHKFYQGLTTQKYQCFL